MHETVGNRIKMNLSNGLWICLIRFYTFLYSLIHFFTIQEFFHVKFLKRLM